MRTGRLYRPIYLDRHGRRKTDRIWWFQFGYRGQPFRGSTKTRDRKEAKSILRRRQEEVQRIGSLDLLTFQDMKAAIVTDYVINSRSALPRLESALKHLETAFEKARAIDITPEAIGGYIQRRRQENAAPATINVELSALTRMFTLAVRSGKLLTQPHIAKLHVDNARKGFFPREDLDRVLEHLPEELRPVVETAYLTGWRLSSEILTRKQEHVDTANGWLRLEPGEAKNREGRNYPLSGRLAAVIGSQIEKTREMEASTGKTDSLALSSQGKADPELSAGLGEGLRAGGRRTYPARSPPHGRQEHGDSRRPEKRSAENGRP